MSKGKSKYTCSECGHESHGWMGRCPGCGAWNTLVEEPVAARPLTGRGNWAMAAVTQASSGNSPVIRLSQVPAEDQPRLSSKMAELDRVLGGGYVRGSLVLIGGDPGIGKSTLLLQCLAAMSDKHKVLYVTGEESPRQIRLRADRLQLGLEPIDVLAATDFSTIAQTLAGQKPDLAVIDSIQTVYVESMSSAPGSVSQIREATAGLLRIAKELGIIIVLVGHVTKDGAIAGPRVLEHMVDTVLYFEGERQMTYRILRCVKNRFGATDELGLFEMTDRGLQEVDNASMALLAGRPIQVPGSVVTACMEGTRPILIEIQALLNAAAYGTPQRMAQGLDRNRIAMLLAVLEKQFQFGLGNMDTYVSVVGGLRLTEPATDLCVLAAVVSSLKNRPIRPACLVFGEIGLTGEVRAVSQADRRIQEAARQGFTTFILPGSCRPLLDKVKLADDCDLFYVDRVGEAMDVLFDEEAVAT
jgi:DNA repair protein RadA/Sms